MTAVTVDIISSVLDGARFLPEFLESLDKQSHADWRLWVRDDGSSDATVEILRAKAAADSRVELIHVGGPPMGVAGAYGWVLERVPADATYIMCGDADDVWLPDKIERTLTAMRAAENTAPPNTPVLVHTDLVVVDEELHVRHPSFWALSGFDPEPATLRRVIVRNVATAPSVMLNRALRELVGKTPPAAAFQDWWYVCVAAAFGKVVALREATVLYRQHGANAVGARDARVSLSDLPRAVVWRLGKTAEFRRGLKQSAEQARAFLDRYGNRLPDDDRRFLAEYARLPELGFLRRKVDLLRLRVLPEYGLLRSLGLGVLVRG
jgi:hypothetical protein